MQKLMKAFHKNQKGFTLVELMVVVVIIGILVAIAIPIFGTVQGNAERRACHANMRTIDGAKLMWNAGSQDLDDWPGEYLVGGLPECPSEGEYNAGGDIGDPTDLDLTECSDHGSYQGS